MSYSNVGKVWTPETFDQYLNTIKVPSWCKSVTMHHTWAPNLETRPRGFTIQHIVNIKNYYQKKLGWSRGPHLFIDEDQIFGMSPLQSSGIHARSFNSTSIGIEVLGNYDTEDPESGRGLESWETAAATARSLIKWMGNNSTIDSSDVKFHREDPKSYKTCPGKKVNKDWFLSLVNNEATDSSSPGTEPEFVPVVEWLVANRGISADTAAKHLSNKGGMVYFSTFWLENSYYNRSEKATYAPVSELKQIPE